MVLVLRKENEYMCNFTTKEQSLNLIKFGLDRDTADMCYNYNFVTETNSEIPAIVVGTLHDTTLNNIPCWSVGALLKLMPLYITKEGVCFNRLIYRNNIEYSAGIGKYDEYLVSFESDSLLESVIECIKYFLENDYIKKM